MPAYIRYWRQFVHSCLQRLCTAGCAEAWEDLVQFYLRAALQTNREFDSHSPMELADGLRRPGLLSSWLESHSALVWLWGLQHAESNGNGKHSDSNALRFPQHWLETWFPEFRRPSLLAKIAQREGQRFAGGLPFQPICRLLTRFAEWSRIGFGLRPDDPIDSEHAQTVCALAQIAVRLPRQQFADDLTKAFAGDRPLQRTLSESWKDAVAMAFNSVFNEAWKNDQWEEIVRLYGDPDVLKQLPSFNRSAAALAYCLANRPLEGLRLGVQAVSDFSREELEAESPVAAFWKNNVLPAALNQTLKLEDASERDKLLEQMEEALVQLPTAAQFAAFREECIAEMQNNLQLVRLRKQIDDTCEQLRPLIDKHAFAAARTLVNKLADDPPDVKKIKTDLLDQIKQAEAAHGIHKQVDAAVEQCQSYVSQGKLANAKRVIRGLPDIPELAKLKLDYLKQLSDLEQQTERTKSENKQLINELKLMGVDLLKVGEIAKENNVDIANELAFNSLLKAVRDHARKSR